MLRRLRVSGLLSFGPPSIDLPLESLNVLIGPNGSGKSNVLEVLALLRAAPRELAEPVKRGGGVREWLWKGAESQCKARVEAIVDCPGSENALRHLLEFTDHGGLFEVTGEKIDHAESTSNRPDTGFRYCLEGGRHLFELTPALQPDARAFDAEKQPSASKPKVAQVPDRELHVHIPDSVSVTDGPALRLESERARPQESVLSQFRDSRTYPELHCLQEQYEQIRLFRNWSFGPRRSGAKTGARTIARIS